MVVHDLFAYVRVSTEDQKDRNTNLNQRQSILRYVENHPDLHIVPRNSKNLFFEDLAISGKSEEPRDAYVEMISRLGEVQGIIIWDVDRMSRDVWGWTAMCKKLAAEEKYLYISKDGQTLDMAHVDEHVLISLIRGYMGWKENKNTSARVKSGIMTRKELGKPWGRVAPQINWDRYDYYRTAFNPPMPHRFIAQMPDIAVRVYNNKKTGITKQTGKVSVSYLYEQLKKRKQAQAGGEPKKEDDDGVD
jgi:DNA invertase Pin-like site-specific DNA recombinase